MNPVLSIIVAAYNAETTIKQVIDSVYSQNAINPLFRAVAECVEESVLSSLLHAETVTGYHGRTVQCLSDLLKK